MTLPQVPFPTLEEVENVRKGGYRPTVLACILFNKKLLFIFKKTQHAWLLPQGGVEQGETVEDALHRELQEELGADIVRTSFEPVLLETANIPFSSSNSKKRPIILETGETVKMIGKCFYVTMVLSKQFWMPLKNGEYDRCQWMTFEESIETLQHMQQEIKKLLLLKLVHTLHEQNHLR